MRFTNAALVASAAAGHVAAGTIGHQRHHQLHAAREAAASVDTSGVNFNDPNLYKNVDWNSVFHKGGSPSSAAPVNAAPSTQVHPSGGSQPTGNPQPSGGSPTQSSSQPSSSSNSHSNSNPIGDLVSSGVGELVGAFTNAGGLNVLQPTNQGFTLGTGQYTINAKNNKGGDMHLICWIQSAGNYAASMVGMGAEKPGCNVKIPAGKTQSISVTPGSSGACAPAWDNTKPAAGIGYVHNTWLEWTMSPSGVVDVSYETNMGGDPIVATVKESGCTSSRDSCGFICNTIQNPALQSCKDANTYTLVNCKGPGANTDQAQANGGCGWPGSNGATIDAVFG